MLIVQVCHLGEDGDAAYRIHDPSRFLGRIDGITTIDCHFAHAALPALSRQADLLILQFVNDWDLLTICRNRRSRGQFTVFEANDYFFDLQPWNPIAQGWSNRINQELYLQLLKEADAVQTSSQALAERWHARGAKEVVVFENHLPQLPPLPESARYVPSTEIASRPLTLGWAGSPGHFADWLSIVPTLRHWLACHPEVRLAVMTNDLAHSFFDLPAERYRFVPFGSLDDYFRFLETIDIGIAPLLPTEYNRCRSDVKFLEYASRGVVGLYQDFEPYRNSVQPGKTGLLWSTHQDLTECLNELITHPERLHSIRTEAHAYVARERMLAARIGERLTWYRQKTGTQVLQAEPIPLPAIDWETGSHYGRLAPGPGTATYIELHSQSGSNAALPKLDEAIALAPDHYPLKCLKGQFLNDLGKGALAREVLESACKDEPDLARGWTELGRAWFRHGEIEKALGALKHALSVNRLYLPAWQYLVRLMIQHRHPDLEKAAREGHALFSDCYPFAFVCVEAMPLDEALAAFCRLLERLKKTIQLYEVKSVWTQTRRMVETLLKRNVAPLLLVPALSRAVELFPDSIAFWRILGESLLRGTPKEAERGYECLATAARLLRQNLVAREECSELTAIPWEWQFAENITLHSPPS